MENPSRNLDIEQLRHLADSDPEAFEHRRRELIDAVIARAPARRRQRLRGLQWRVDQVRSRSSNPLAACISLSDMMWEAFAGSNGLVETLRGNREDGEAGPSCPLNVVPLDKKPVN